MVTVAEGFVETAAGSLAVTAGFGVVVTAGLVITAFGLVVTDVLGLVVTAGVAAGDEEVSEGLLLSAPETSAVAGLAASSVAAGSGWLSFVTIGLTSSGTLDTSDTSETSGTSGTFASAFSSASTGVSGTVEAVVGVAGWLTRSSDLLAVEVATISAITPTTTTAAPMTVGIGNMPNSLVGCFWLFAAEPETFFLSGLMFHLFGEPQFLQTASFSYIS